MACQVCRYSVTVATLLASAFAGVEWACGATWAPFLTVWRLVCAACFFTLALRKVVFGWKDAQ